MKQGLIERTSQVFGLDKDTVRLFFCTNNGNQVPIDSFDAFKQHVCHDLVSRQPKRDDKGRIVIVLNVSTVATGTSPKSKKGYSVAYTAPTPSTSTHSRQAKQPADAMEPIKTLLGNFVSNFNAHMLDTFGDHARPFELDLIESKPKVEHRNVFCDQCLGNIVGTRFKCADCSNYDLCTKCFDSSASFHQAGHRFKVLERPQQETGEIRLRAADTVPTLPLTAASAAQSTTSPQQQHPATCDMCDSSIRGIRYKCQDCPDYDVCSACFARVSDVHPGHAFVAITHPRHYLHRTSHAARAVHHGVRCDDCGSQPIRGARFKCTHCDDFDLCANCEASPLSTHPVEHAFLKIRSPVTTTTTTTTAAPIRASHSPSNRDIEERVKKEDLTRESEMAVIDAGFNALGPLEHPTAQAKGLTESAVTRASEMAEQEPRKLGASFVADVTLSDGTLVAPGSEFSKVWSILNTGNVAWPAGTRLVNVGGWSRLYNNDDKPATTTFEVAPSRPGEQVEIACDVKAPEDEGSYVDYWRLVDDEGRQFGDRLWIDVRVVVVARSSVHSSLSGSSLVIPTSVSPPPAPSSTSPSMPTHSSTSAAVPTVTTGTGDDSDSAEESVSGSEDSFSSHSHSGSVRSVDTESDPDSDEEDFVVLSAGSSSSSSYAA